MPPINRPRQNTIRKSDIFDDQILPGQTSLQDDSIDLETDNNAQRSQIARILDAFGITPWTSDIVTVNGKKRALKQLNEDLGTIEGISETIDSFVPTENQTVFTLSQLPIDPSQPIANINTLIFFSGFHFSISGSTLTLNISYKLDSSDFFIVKYKYQS